MDCILPQIAANRGAEFESKKEKAKWNVNVTSRGSGMQHMFPKVHPKEHDEVIYIVKDEQLKPQIQQQSDQAKQKADHVDLQTGTSIAAILAELSSNYFWQKSGFGTVPFFLQNRYLVNLVTRMTPQNFTWSYAGLERLTGGKY